MSDVNHVIEPARFGIWIAVTFVVAVLALILSLVAVSRTNTLTTITQGEVLLLNKKIGGTQPEAAPPAEAEAAAQ
ncbi:hypothetical protein [Methylotenera sp. G11]|uniref:hypothetical protein n=1 Tax=Methylotenera sp. G11 TaxID=1506585 RepID=UPI000647B4AA|nr:hypothetical protein [Methylotenera sp. G11]